MIDFLAGGSVVLGRPVDCVQARDGSILVSDDTGNKIFRLSHAGK
jgi:glucose/arabinose dehydrogenase